MKVFNHILAVLVWVSVCVALASKSGPLLGFLFFVPFTLGPHAVSHALCFFVRSRWAEILLSVGMLGYVSWFFFVYVDVFYIHLDPQSSIALLFVGVVSLPVMIPVWAGALVIERSARFKRKKAAAAG
jgi:hypothetical protein